MSLKPKCHSNWNVTKNWNVTITEMPLKLKYHFNSNFIKMVKLKCHWNWNVQKKMWQKSKCQES